MKKMILALGCLIVVLAIVSCSGGKIISSRTFNTKDSIQVIIWEDKGGISVLVLKQGEDPYFHNPGGGHYSLNQVITTPDSIGIHTTIKSTGRGYHYRSSADMYYDRKNNRYISQKEMDYITGRHRF